MQNHGVLCVLRVICVLHVRDDVLRDVLEIFLQILEEAQGYAE